MVPSPFPRRREKGPKDTNDATTSSVDLDSDEPGKGVSSTLTDFYPACPPPPPLTRAARSLYPQSLPSPWNLRSLSSRRCPATASEASVPPNGSAPRPRPATRRGRRRGTRLSTKTRTKRTRRRKTVSTSGSRTSNRLAPQTIAIATDFCLTLLPSFAHPQLPDAPRLPADYHGVLCRCLLRAGRCLPDRCRRADPPGGV